MAWQPITISVREDATQVQRQLRHLKGGANKVLTRALNKTIKPVQTAAVRAIAKDLRIKQKDVRKAMKLQRANYSHLNAYIEASGRRLPLMAFTPRQTRKGVSYRAWKGGRQTVPGAFIVTMRSGHTGVFKRESKKRLPIDELYGASIPYVMARQYVTDAMQRTAVERWRRNVAHELEFYLSRYG